MVVRIIAFAAGILGCLPLTMRARIGRLLGGLFSLLPTRDAEIARLQMKIFLGPQYAKNLPRVYGSLGETVLEALNLAPIMARYKDFVTADWAYLESVRQRKQPIVALAAHTGNWELLAASIAKAGFAVSVIAKEARKPGFQAVLRSIREKSQVRTIWRAGNAAIKQIAQALGDKEVVAALIDQDTRVSSLMVPFFGRPAATPSSIVELAKKYNAAIFTSFIFRTGLNHYEIFVKEIDAALPTAAILEEYHRELETLLRRFPEQWVWMHKRWRTAGDARMSSGEYLKFLKTLL